MVSEFEKRFKKLNFLITQIQKIIKVFGMAGKQLPFLSCPSTSECATFGWSLKWFGIKK